MIFCDKIACFTLVSIKPNLIFIVLLETLISFCKLQEDEESVIPSFLPLSSEHISDEGIYLLENGHDCLIYVGDSVSPDIVRKIFGVSTVDEIPHLVISMLISLSLSPTPCCLAIIWRCKICQTSLFYVVVFKGISIILKS